MVVEEFHDQKIIYHLNIDEEVNNILMHLSSLKTIKTNRVIKGTTLVGAFYIFSVWLDKPSYRLYKEENILVLRFLRNADGIDDINASTTQQEYIDKYIAKKYGYLEKKSEHQDDDKNESRQNDMTIESQQDSKKIKKIDEGYQKIYQTYIKETDAEYRKDYNAKGYSYIVTYEDETQIRYLMYDRDNQEGTKTQYVYYKNIKSTDGSWSMMDAEILDMYQYDYESKEVKDLQKTSW